MIRKLLLLLGLVLAPGIAHATCPVIPFVFPATSINPLQVNTNFATIRDCITSATGLTQVSSSTALRALQAGLYPMIYRQYNLNPGDGAAVYSWASGSACTDDGVGCIEPASNPPTGRWLLSASVASSLTTTGAADVGTNLSAGGTLSVTGAATVGGNIQSAGSIAAGTTLSAVTTGAIGTTLTVGDALSSGYAFIINTDASARVSDVGGMQFGVGGPFLTAQGALDTLTVQSQPGALPSGDTTNFQLFPPAIGGKAFLNIAMALANPADENRLLIGTDGNAWIFGETLGGAGTCQNIAFIDGQGAEPAWSMICGSAGSTPSFAIGKLGAVLGQTSTAFVGMILVDVSDNLVVGQGASIVSLVLGPPVEATTVSLSAATPTVAGGKVGFGTTTAAAASCNSAGAIAPTGCLIVDFGGTPRAIPFF